MKVLSLFTLLLFYSCSHSVHLVHMSDHSLRSKPRAGKTIKSLGEQFVIMGLVFDTQYVDEARRKLMNQCQNGTIKNIMTRYSTSHGFFSWTNKVYMEGTCIKRRRS